MMNRLATQAAAMMYALVCVACTFTPGTTDVDLAAGETITVRLSRNANGDLEHCTPQGCSTHPNPQGCEHLDISIQNATGATCETCLDAQLAEIGHTCTDTLTSCTVVPAPEPDCVVCAFIDGAVIYSSCEAGAELDCVYFSPSAPGGGASSSDPDACEVCFDTYGNEVISSCVAACANVSCRAVACGPGFRAARSAGDCCDVCVPQDSCANVICSREVAVPSCPSGTTLTRDAVDCCVYFCQLLECPALDPSFSCPAGFEAVNAYPECSRCAPVSKGGSCTQTSDCGPSEMCSTEAGDCQAGPPCGGSEKCPAVAQCYGQCLPVQSQCAEVVLPATRCAGELRSDGLDTTGCPLPPTCHCPDGTVSFDGTCVDLCADTACFATVHQCAPGERLVNAYPHCCGMCVPEDQCVAGESIGNGSFVSSLNCPDISCGPGYHPEIGPECCEVCVRDEASCQTTDDCLAGEACPVAATASKTCEVAVFCIDTDGVDPFTQGTVTGVHPAHGEYAVTDSCANDDQVVEHFCFQPYPGNAQTWWTEVTYTCEYGCKAGACLPKH